MRATWKCGLSLALAFAMSVTAVPAQTKAFTGFKTVEQEKAELSDGTYQVPVTLMHATQDRESTGNAALVPKAKVVVENGTTKLYFSFQEMVVQGMSGYLSSASVLSDITFDANGNPEKYTETPVDVLSSYDVVDEYNKESSTDVNCAGKAYPKQMSATIASGETYVWIKIYIPIMASFNMGTQYCRIRIDYDKAAEYQAPDTAELDGVIQKAEELKTDNFTTESTEKLESALKAAKVVKENEYFLQQDVDEAVAALDTAYNDMEANLADGVYDIDAAIWNASKNQLSMSNGMLEAVKATVKDGKITLSVTVKPLTVNMGGEDITSYAQGWGAYAGDTVIEAEITKKDEEGNPVEFTYEMPEQKMVTRISLNSVRWQDARLYLDFAQAKKTDSTPSTDNPNDSNEQEVTISLNKSKVVLYTKQQTTAALKAVVSGAEKVTWSSSNKKVATVSAAGKVTAKSAGTAVITAKAGNAEASCTVVVKKPSLKVAKTTITLAKNKKATIKATATPSGKITYLSSNKKVATVSSKGVVKAKKKGQAKITVSCNGVKKVVKVTVK